MATFPTNIKFSSIKPDTDINVVSNIEALSGKSEVILGDQIRVTMDLRTTPLTENDDRSFQIFRQDIKDYGLIEFNLSEYGVFKPLINSQSQVTLTASATEGSVNLSYSTDGTSSPIAKGSYIQIRNNDNGILHHKLYLVRNVTFQNNIPTGTLNWNSATTYALNANVLFSRSKIQEFTITTSANTIVRDGLISFTLGNGTKVLITIPKTATDTNIINILKENQYISDASLSSNTITITFDISAGDAIFQSYIPRNDNISGGANGESVIASTVTQTYINALYRSLQASNTNNNPVTATTFWSVNPNGIGTIQLASGLTNSVAINNRIAYDNLIGQFRCLRGDWNNSASTILRDGSQTKVYRFTLAEEL